MHKKILPLFLLALCPLVAMAQPTLTASNFNPVITDAFAIKICNTASVAPGAGTAATTWDFTSLVATGDDTGKVNTCPSTASTAHCSMFPGANIFMKGFGLSYQTAYYNDNTSGQSIYGYYSAPDTNIILTDPADQFQFPMFYGKNYTDPYAGTVTIGALSGHVNGTINVNCDGYGTLKLPGRIDDNVLRVHTSQLFNDSVYLVATSPIVIVYTIETYSWYKPDYHAPLLSIATITPFGSSTPAAKFVAYTPAQVNAVVQLPSNMSELNIYPNPSQGDLNIDFTAKSVQNIRISLLDITGREVAIIADKMASGTQHISYNTATLQPALYMARIQCGTETITRKIDVQ